MTEEDRERTEAIARVREHLSFLPGGVPNSLWNYNKDTLAEAIVDGEKRRSKSGMPLVKIDGKWYYNDHGDFVTYLKEYVED
jgi:hypothetical protein